MADVTLPGRRALTLGWLVPIFETLAVGGALVLALRLRLQSLDAYTGSFDEGIRSEQLLLMSAGYRPFRDIFASQGPLLLDLLYPFFSAFGQTLAAARLGVVVCSAVALVGAWWIGRQVAGPFGGLAAVLALGLSRVFLEGSRLALAEVPTIAPSLLAVGAALAYGRPANRRLLVVSAGCCALALLIKPMALHLGAPLLVLLVAPWVARGALTPRPPREPLTPRWPTMGPLRCAGSPRPPLPQGARGSRLVRVAVDLLLFGAIVGGICAAVVVALGPTQVWDNLGAYRAGAGHPFGADRLANLRLTANVMAQEQLGLYVLAGAGVLLGLWRRPVLTLALAAWVLAILALFMVYGDLADKHIVYLVPPVALLAALGVGLTIEVIGEIIRTPPTMARQIRRLLVIVVGAIGVLGYIWFLPALYRADVYLIREAPRVAAERRGWAADLEIAEIIRARTPPDGWVLADNPNAAFEARRLVIPYLVDTSGTRVDAGSLTSRLAIDQIQQYRPSVIVTWPRRLGKLDELVRSLPSLGYRLERSYELGWKVYVRD